MLVTRGSYRSSKLVAKNLQLRWGKKNHFWKLLGERLLRHHNQINFFESLAKSRSSCLKLERRRLLYRIKETIPRARNGRRALHWILCFWTKNLTVTMTYKWNCKMFSTNLHRRRKRIQSHAATFKWGMDGVSYGNQIEKIRRKVYFQNLMIQDCRSNRRACAAVEQERRLQKQKIWLSIESYHKRNKTQTIPIKWAVWCDRRTEMASSLKLNLGNSNGRCHYVTRAMDDHGTWKSTFIAEMK